MTTGYYLQGLARYVDFEGRAGRAEFWWFNLVLYGIQFAIALLGIVFPALETVSEVMLRGHALGTALPQFAVTARRLHGMAAPYFVESDVIPRGSGAAGSEVGPRENCSSRADRQILAPPACFKLCLTSLKE